VKHWTYDGAANTWTSGSPSSVSPTASQYFALAFDPTTAKAVLFGGLNINNAPLGDTWVYDSAANTWVLALPGGSETPSPRIDCAVVYELKTNKVILFGGRSDQGRPADLPNKTWGYVP
jgi:hypothetical protein